MRAEGMSPFLALGLLVAGLCSRVHCVPADDLASKIVTLKDQIKKLPAPNTAVVSSNTDFAFSLYKQLVSLDPSKNVIFSPLSVSIALAFLSLGARGPTLTELLEGLKFNVTETPEAEIHQGFQHLLQALSQPSNLLQLNVGNAMFVDEHLKLLDKFVQEAHELYHSEVFPTKFQDLEAARRLINDYVKNKTEGKIVELIKKLSPQTVAVLVNYIYFKAQWKMPFNPNITTEADFHVSKNRTVRVPMMGIMGRTVPYFRDEELACTVVELPYTSNDSTLFILPDDGRMVDVEAKLLPETLRRWRDSLHPRRIDALHLPRFSISSDYKLQEILPRLGIKKIFSEEADLSGITDTTPLCVSQVVHSAMLDVGEEGTEGAASTGVVIDKKSFENFIVRFDSPFLFATVLRDTQSIIFLGKVVNPRPDQSSPLSREDSR
ncbi:serpin A3-8-like [Phacochoerus africanus]|uniref:serpin A3-8-like n=1 Tax=Phacochoerus africanus TaxID=41426 RepID=UPI001FD9179D|nr:serpin A3-8-like [Phacochoerus africanus]